MKKIALMAVMAMFTMKGFSQGSAVLTAFDLFEEYKREKAAGNEAASILALTDAKKELDKAAVHPTTSLQSKTWKRRGDVYFEIATNPSPRLVLEKPGALDTAIANYKLSLTVEKKENGKPVIEDKGAVLYALSTIANTILFKDAEKMMGKAEEFSAGSGKDAQDKATAEFKKAAAKYLAGYEIYQALLVVDPKNKELMANNDFAMESLIMASIYAGDSEAAEKYGTVMLASGNGAPWLYDQMTKLYTSRGDTVKAADVLQKGKEKYPNDSKLFIAELRMALDVNDVNKATRLLEEGKTKFPEEKAAFTLEEINFYVAQENDEKAIKSLEDAVILFRQDKADSTAGFPILKVIYLNAGIIYDKLASKTLATNKELAESYTMKAMEYYNLAVKLDPKYAPAYRQLASYHVNRGNAFIIEANNLPLEKAKEYEAMNKKGMDELTKAGEFLEKEYAITKEEGLKTLLLDIYRKTKQYDKVKTLQGE